MTDKQILKKAIEKAVKNGYDNILENLTIYVNEEGIIEGTDGRDRYRYHINEIIFSHSFAKAFWGDNLMQVTSIMDECLYDDVYDDGVSYYELPAWQCHLQQMVLEKEPLKYIEIFLK